MRFAIAEHRERLDQLCRQFGVHRLDLFGSAVRDDFDPERSDLDWLVTFQDRPDLGPADRFLGLYLGLEALFQRRIDLVEERAIRNPYFRQQIEQERLVVYRSDAA